MTYHTRIHLKRAHSWPHGIVTHLLGIGLLSIVLAYPLMLLWNWLMPALFGLPLLGFWQTTGLFLLGRLLLGPLLPPPIPHSGPREDWEYEMNGGWGKWKYYNEYWNQEGKKAFEEYIQRKEEEKSKKEKK